MLAALEFSDGANYLDSMSKIADLKQANTKNVSDSAFIAAFEGIQVKFGFFAYNYQNPTVAALVTRAKGLVTDAGFKSFCDDVLSGAKKSNDSNFFEYYSRPTPEILPTPTPTP